MRRSLILVMIITSSGINFDESPAGPMRLYLICQETTRQPTNGPLRPTLLSLMLNDNETVRLGLALE